MRSTRRSTPGRRQSVRSARLASLAPVSRSAISGTSRVTKEPFPTRRGRSIPLVVDRLQEAAMLNDIRLALRTLPRTPGYALAFVLTLGLGIGANTAIFSVINGVLLRPLPYPGPDRIMHLRQPQLAAGVDDTSFSFAEVADYRSAARTVDQFVEREA